MEIWKDIPGYEGKYQASTQGRIRSVDRTISNGNGTYFKKGQPIHSYLTVQGHHVIRLSANGKSKTHYVHRIVLETFRGLALGKLIRHLDGNPNNNCLANPAYGTKRDNALDEYRLGSKNKLSLSDVSKIRRLLDCGETQTRISVMFGVSQAMISRIKLGVAFDWFKEDGTIEEAIN